MSANNEPSQSDYNQDAVANREETNYRQLEVSLPENEQLFHTIFEQAATGMGLATMTGKWVLVNQKLGDILGYTRKELLQKAYQDITYPDDAEADVKCVQKLLSGSQRLSWEKRFIRSNGATVWTQLTASLVRDAMGKPEYMISVVEDISDRKQAEEAQIRSLREQESMMEAIPDIVYVLDRDGNLIKWNKKLETVTGLPPEVLQGRSALAFFPQEEQATIAQVIAEVFEQGKAEVEGHLIGKDETLLLYEWNSVRLRDEVGNDIGITGIGREIAQRKRAEEVLRQQAERERLVAAIAQRIRQSLNLTEILSTTVAEVRQFLQTDRVIIYRYEPGYQSGTVVVESVDSKLPSLLGRTIDGCNDETLLQSYKLGHILAAADIYTAKWTQARVELLSQFQVRAKLAVPIQQGEQLWGLLIVHHCSGTRQWQQFEIDLIGQLATQVAIAIDQAQLYEQKQYQVQREQALNRVMQAIRSSLDLDTIFATAVREVGKLLPIAWVGIAQYLPERKLWLNVAEYCPVSDLPPAVGVEIPDEDNEFAAQLKRLEVVRLDDASTCKDEVNRQLAKAFPGAWLMVPLHFNASVWGSLCLLVYGRTYQWQDSEVELACAVAAQIAVAIQQSELYQQVQQLNTGLERQVQQRTAQLQQALNLEATLKRITDKVRDSLDESQILQTAVQELALGLKVKCCNAALYNLEQTTSTIRYEYTYSIPPTCGCVVQMADLPEIYSQLLRGQYFQYCPLPNAPLRTRVTILSCPIFDAKGVMGDLWLFKQPEDAFDDLEIRLVQQIANQCAIAMRQARLYQAVQAQVEEQAKLNRLKDDFLSTVSHELRTPMTNMKMAIQMLTVAYSQEGTLAQQEKAYQYLQILQDECAREISLIEDLLDLQRLESGEQSLEPEPIQIQTWLPQAIAPFQPQIQNASQQLQLDLSPNLPDLVCDAYSLRRIMAELLTNACKYTPPGEQITVRVAARLRLMQFQVSNSGTEIPASELPHLFDKFYRVPTTDPWKQHGTGLGLALAKELIEHLGGTIAVESSSNQTCFTVELPLEPG